MKIRISDDAGAVLTFVVLGFCVVCFSLGLDRIMGGVFK